MKSDVFSFWTSIVGILLTVLGYFTHDSPIQVWILSLLLIIFIILSCYINFQNKIALRYLKGEAQIRSLHNSLMQEAIFIKDKNFDGIIHALSDICTEISEAFETIKDVKIGVCIKYINGSLDHPYVKTLCRDSHSNNYRKDFDNSETIDYLAENTDFAYIFQQIDKQEKFDRLYYFKNKLANLHQYSNTHLKNINLPSGLFAYYKRRKKWPLPYKSTIVVPFLSYDGKMLDGFLCIDSPKSNGFIENKDVVILQQIALFMREIITFVCQQHLNKCV